MDVNVRYENRNGRLYAYTSTSRRVPGHKNPVSVKEYIGVVDPVTGDIVEKHPRSGSRTAMLDGSSVSNHGDVLLALTMAERMGILDDLRQVFGERHKRILAVILAQTIRPSMSDRLDVVFEMSGLSEVLGMDRMTSDDVYDAVSDISREDMSSFFRRRHIRNPGVRFVYALAIPVVSEGAVSSVTMGSAGISDCVTIVIMMSQSGELIEFRSLGRIQDSIGAIGGILGDVEDGEECVFIPDARLSPYLDLSGLVRSGIGFAIPFVPPSIQFGAVHQDYADVEEGVPEERHGEQVPPHDRSHMGAVVPRRVFAGTLIGPLSQGMRFRSSLLHVLRPEGVQEGLRIHENRHRILQNPT